ncbi:MAG: transposase [Bacteroidota bacterium]
MVAEHLRLGSWDLLNTWSGKYEQDIEPRIAMQIVHESALCVNRIRPSQSICHQGFELANGLPYLVTDQQVHDLLNAHTISEAKQLQIVLGKLRQVNGHYNGNLLAVDPHRIITASQRIMPKKKKKPGEKADKVLQTFFCLDTQTGQPLCSTIGSSGKTATEATLELIDMIKNIQPQQNGLLMADTEHFTIALLKHVHQNTSYNILVPVPNTEKVKELMQTLEYHRKWAGFAIAQTPYMFNKSSHPFNLIVQREGEIASEYRYKAFISTSDKEVLSMITKNYPERWTIEEFFNFEGNMGWNRASTMNLNIRYGKMSLALIAQAAVCQLRKKLPAPYKKWTASHLADTIFHGFDGDLRVEDDTIVVTFYNVPDYLYLQNHYVNLPNKLEKEGINPKVPWLYNFKVDFRFK